MSTLQQLAEPLVYLLALGITVYSGRLVYRQHLTSYHIVRSFLLGVYVLISLLMLLDLYRVTLATSGFIMFYAALSIVLGLLQGILLLAAAQGIYFSPDTSYRTFFAELLKRRWHAFLFLAFLAFAAFVAFFAIAAQPAPAGQVTDFAGNLVPSMVVSPDLVALVIGIFAFFLVYPTSLMLVGASKVENARLRQSLIGLGLGWAGVSALYVAVETVSWTYHYDATGLMYLANAVIFFFIIRNFRKSASLAGFVELTRAKAPEAQPAHQGWATNLAEALEGKKALYEVDSRIPYDQTLRGILEEFAWSGHRVFVFTPKAGPLHGALTGGAGIKLFLTTREVSYTKVAEGEGEVLVPQEDTAVLLDVVDKIAASGSGKDVFVFDNVSELLILIGLEKTYKFLKDFLALLHEERFTALFLFIVKAHGAQEVNLLRGLFASHFVEDAEGPRLAK